MKRAVMIAALFALCSAARFSPRQMLNTNCNDQAVNSYVADNLPAQCFGDENVTPEMFCSDNCTGAVCTFWADNGYSASCVIPYITVCLGEGITPPASCERCFDSTIVSELFSLPASCGVSAGRPPQDFCNDECAGSICTTYNASGYPTDCGLSIAQDCVDGGQTAPAMCGTVSGSLALVMAKGVTVILVLISAALLIF